MAAVDALSAIQWPDMTAEGDTASDAAASDFSAPRGPLQLSGDEIVALRAAANELVATWAGAPAWTAQLAHACQQRHATQRFEAVVPLLRQAVEQGVAALAVQLLELLARSAPIAHAERWLPLVVPMRVVTRGHKLPLRRLAPELRGIAEAVLDAIHQGEPLPDEPRRATRYGQRKSKDDR